MSKAVLDIVSAVSKLLSAALGNAPVPALDGLDAEDWKTIFGVLSAQNVQSLIYDVLPDSVPSELRTVWAAKTEAVEKQNRLEAAVCAAQEKAWKREGIEYCLLKGESLSTLYPHPLRRGCGDIDWYFPDARSWDAALALARKNATYGICYDSDGDLHYDFKGVTIEHHRDWSHLSSPGLRRLASAPIVTDGRLSPEDSILMLSTHILHHLAWKGMALKQFADLAVVLRAYEGQYDQEAFASRLDSLGLSRWCNLLFATTKQLTALPEACLPIKIDSANPDIDKLIALVLADGYGRRKLGSAELLARVGLMWKYSRREGLARYWGLMRGRIGQKC